MYITTIADSNVQIKYSLLLSKSTVSAKITQIRVPYLFHFLEYLYPLILLLMTYISAVPSNSICSVYFAALVQVAQIFYQKNNLYRLRALGQRHNMDITVGKL